MTTEDPPPYIRAPEPIMVQAMVRGERFDGQVLGWRGDRVYLRYRSPAGNHLAWVPAADVERV